MNTATDKQMPIMDLKDHKANKHDLFVRYFGELRAWIALAMQQPIAQLKDAPSSLGFDWMFVDLSKMTPRSMLPGVAATHEGLLGIAHSLLYF